MYVMDYGAPVGYRLALKHPERVSALIIQNGNAYEEGLKKFWDPIKAYWADGSPAHRKALEVPDEAGDHEFQYTDGMSDFSRIDPDNCCTTRPCWIGLATWISSSISSMTTDRTFRSIRNFRHSSATGSRRR